MVRVFNDRGACLAGVVIDDRLRPGVVQLSTGAWFDPLDPADPDAMCVHGNPNVLTADVGTSRWRRAAPATRAGRDRAVRRASCRPSGRTNLPVLSPRD